MFTSQFAAARRFVFCLLVLGVLIGGRPAAGACWNCDQVRFACFNAGGFIWIDACGSGGEISCSCQHSWDVFWCASTFEQECWFAGGIPISDIWFPRCLLLC